MTVKKMSNGRLGWPLFIAASVFLTVVFLIIFFIVVMPSPEKSFANGWVCATIHAQQDSNYLLKEPYPNGYCRAFAEEWDKRSVGKYGF